MAKKEINNALQIASRKLTNLFKAQIKKMGLIESGKLYNSIKFTYVPVGNGNYSFKMESMDYFEFLDEKYGITNAVINTTAYKKIMEDVSYVIISEMVSELTENRNQ